MTEQASRWIFAMILVLSRITLNALGHIGSALASIRSYHPNSDRGGNSRDSAAFDRASNTPGLHLDKGNCGGGWLTGFFRRDQLPMEQGTQLSKPRMTQRKIAQCAFMEERRVVQDVTCPEVRIAFAG